MKLSKEELSAKINELPIDDEVKISLMEDIADSFEITETEDKTGELEELKIKYDALKEKYKERFLKGDEVLEEEKKEEDETEDEELKEEEVIDIKEI